MMSLCFGLLVGQTTQLEDVSLDLINREKWQHLNKLSDIQTSAAPQESITRSQVLQGVSPRCVICSGICTGICSAATELGAGLPPLSSSRVSRIWRAEEEGLPGPDDVCEDDMSSWRPFRRTGHTHLRVKLLVAT